MIVTLVDSMGSDLSVVNAARVSFSKESNKFSDKDEKLINYLAKHNHWSPFGHASLQFRIKAPIFVARQLVKHQVGLVWNEVSRRYVDDEPEFYVPKAWRLKAENKKQGSSDEAIEYNLGSTLEFVKTTYQNMLKAGIAPEMARMVLPQNLYTEYYGTVNLNNLLKFIDLRTHMGAQWEIQKVAEACLEIATDLWPITVSSYRELRGGE